MKKNNFCIFREQRESEVKKEATIQSLGEQIETLETATERKERAIKELKLDLELKLEEMMHIKVSLRGDGAHQGGFEGR